MKKKKTEIKKHELIEATVNVHMCAIYKRRIEPIIEKYNKMVDELNLSIDEITLLKKEIKKHKKDNKILKDRIVELERAGGSKIINLDYYIQENNRLRNQNASLYERNKKLSSKIELANAKAGK